MRVTFANHGLGALPTHGFIPVVASATGPSTASAASFATMKTAFVVGVPDANTLDLMQRGFLQTATAHGLTVGAMYYLSTAGAITATRPTTGNLQRVCEVWSANLLLLIDHQPLELG